MAPSARWRGGGGSPPPDGANTAASSGARRAGCFPRRSLLGYRHAVVCDDWEDAPRARFDSLSYSLLAPGADAMSAAHETHLTRLWDHLGSWFAIEDRV